MGRRRLAPPREELADMIAAGMTHQQIAAHASARLGRPIARSTIAAAVLRDGLGSPRPRYVNEIPWLVATQHLDQYPARMLRLLGQSRQNPSRVRSADWKRLANWIRTLRMNGLVVAYSSEIGFIYLVGEPTTTATPIRQRPLTTGEVSLLVHVTEGVSVVPKAQAHCAIEGCATLPVGWSVARATGDLPNEVGLCGDHRARFLALIAERPPSVSEGHREGRLTLHRRVFVLPAATDRSGPPILTS